MRYGVCFGMDQIDQVAMTKRAGFDYVESGFQQIVFDDDARRQAFAAALRENDILCEAANCFIPGNMSIIGKDFARQEMVDFIETGFRRGKELGLQVVSFGSGGARALPDGVPFAEGVRQLGAFLRTVVAPLAEKYEITVAVEPLRPQECNIIHTLNEGVMLATMAESDAVSCLADVFHMRFAGETFDDVRRLKGCIAHGHISNPAPVGSSMGRTFPLADDEFDYGGFVRALEDAGCTRCSIEAGTADFASDVQKAGAVLCKL